MPAHTHVALLRGINVGGKNKLAMKDLAALFSAAGCGDVRTYIQSGNVVFTVKPAHARGLAAKIAGEIASQFGLRVPVVMRTAMEIGQVIGANPFLDAGDDPKLFHVAFLADEPEPGRVAGLDASRSPPDAFVVRGREIYLHFPNGVAATRLSNDYFDRQLATTSTMRNWSTVLKLGELAGGP